MSESEQDQPQKAENDQSAENARGVEVETGPLMPRWLKVSIWVVLVPFVVVAWYSIIHSMITQHKLLIYIRKVTGPWEGNPPSMESKVITNGRDLFEEEARSSLLFILQRMVIEEVNDPRMAKAMTLRKAMDWGVNSARREMIEELLEHMDSDGSMPPNYILEKEDKKLLDQLIEERKQREDTGYEEEKITTVLEWIQSGRPTQAKGPERRRIVALRKKYDKRVFFDYEKNILAEYVGKWVQSKDEVKKEVAQKFELMQKNEACALSEDGVQLCSEKADVLEESYLRGQNRLSQLAVHLVKYIERENIFIDHPDVWEVIRLCEHRYEPVRKNMKDATFALRNRKYCLMFMSDFLRKTEINPVMAVETARLTKDEHEAKLRRANHRRRMALLDVAERIALEYCEDPYSIDGVPAGEQKEYFSKYVIEPVELLSEDDDSEVAERAGTVMETLREECKSYLE